MKRRFVCYYFYVGWHCWSFGLSIDVKSPNIEIHLPTGFVRIGFILTNGVKAINHDEVDKVTFGIK